MSEEKRNIRFIGYEEPRKVAYDREMGKFWAQVQQTCIVWGTIALVVMLMGD